MDIERRIGLKPALNGGLQEISMIRTLTIAAAVATFAIAVPFAAFAQQGGPMGGMGQMGPFTLAQMQERSDGRLLHSTPTMTACCRPPKPPRRRHRAA